MSEKINPLNKIERLELQNIVLRMQLQQEKIENLNLQRLYAGETMNNLRNKLADWNKKFESKRLSKHNLKISDVDINTDTGEIELVKNSNLVELIDKAEGQ